MANFAAANLLLRPQKTTMTVERLEAYIDTWKGWKPILLIERLEAYIDAWKGWKPA